MCPRADAYALGLDRELAIPIIVRNGQQTSIHEMALW